MVSEPARPRHRRRQVVLAVGNAYLDPHFVAIAKAELLPHLDLAVAVNEFHIDGSVERTSQDWGRKLAAVTAGGRPISIACRLAYVYRRVELVAEGLVRRHGEAEGVTEAFARGLIHYVQRLLVGILVFLQHPTPGHAALG